MMNPRRYARTGPKRFWAKVLKTRKCWKWLGSKCKGYGHLRFGPKLVKAHRYSYTLAYGPIPAGLFVLHKCDNPECTNPRHLTVGTNSDNMRDCANKNRHGQGKKTHCPRGHAYTPKNTYLMASGSRFCRLCGNIRMRQYREQSRGNHA